MYLLTTFFESKGSGQSISKFSSKRRSSIRCRDIGFLGGAKGTTWVAHRNEQRQAIPFFNALYSKTKI